MRCLFVAVFLLIASAPLASPQTGDLVMEHYQAYRAAFERGDVAAATVSAEQALAASQARDGAGGHTVVLAFNLAAIRMLGGDYDGAAAPAQLAYELSRAGAGGIDPALAELTLARVQLGTLGRQGADWLRVILGRSRLSDLPEVEVHRAAAELGSWALGQRDYDLARRAWDVAAQHASGSALGQAYGFGQARTWQAASIILPEIGRRGRSRMDPEDAQRAHAMLTEALAALGPLANAEPAYAQLTAAQQAYADARAWESVLRAKLSSDGLRLPRVQDSQSDADGFSEFRSADPGRPRCLFQLNAQPRPEYPPEQLSRGGFAGVVLRLRIDARGGVIESNTVARVGDDDFSREIERLAPRWTVAVRDDSQPDCRVETTLLVPVSFSMRQ